MTTTRQLIASPVRAAVAALVLACAGPVAAQVLGPPPTPAVGAPSPGAQPSADWRAALTELKLAPSGDVVRKKRHMEVDATTADGRRVLVSFDLTGRVWEIEDESTKRNATVAPSIRRRRFRRSHAPASPNPRPAKSRRTIRSCAPAPRRARRSISMSIEADTSTSRFGYGRDGDGRAERSRQAVPGRAAAGLGCVFPARALELRGWRSALLGRCASERFDPPSAPERRRDHARDRR